MRLEEIGVNKRTITALNKKHIYTVNDLLNCVPRAYKNYSKVVSLEDAVINEENAIKGHLMTIEKKSNYERAYVKAEAVCEESGKSFSIFWFGNTYMYQFYKLLEGMNIVVCGKITDHPTYGLSISNPDIFEAAENFKPRIMPVYRKYQGVAEKTLKKLIFENLKNVTEPVEQDILDKYGLLSYKSALYALHAPKSEQDIYDGKKRLLFNELFYFAMKLQQNGCNQKKGIIFSNRDAADHFISKDLSFELTEDQRNTIELAIGNAQKGIRNNLLVQGDVGCGKTVVAFALMIDAVSNGYQAALLAPTQILAEQHYKDLSTYLENTNYKYAYLHSGLKASERRNIIKGIASGEYDIVVGTHNICGKDVVFKNLGLIVTDEEHKFGVEQKESLKEKGAAGVHVISMSATPLPRSLAGITFGEDKDILQIRTMPRGRVPVQTAIQRGYTNTFPFMEKEIRNGHQCYVVCPAIEDNENVDIKAIESVKTEYEKYFLPKGMEIGVVHGKMKKEEVAEVIDRFVKNEIQILMSTTVIEVGVNVPNATVMVIEQADRFGLASLHQLRGRVGRSKNKSYCILISENKTNERLVCMTQTTSGFEIAERDLELRGSGDLIGIRQSGFDKYIAEIISHPEFYERIKITAAESLKNGKGQKLIQLVEEKSDEEKYSKTG